MKTRIAAGAVFLLLGSWGGWEAGAGPMTAVLKDEPVQEDIRGHEAGAAPQLDFKEAASAAQLRLKPSQGLQELQRSLMAEAYNGIGDDKDAAQGGASKAPPPGRAPLQLPDPLLDLRKGIGEFLQVDEIDGMGRPLGVKNSMVTEWRAVDAAGSELFSGAGSLSSSHDQGSLSQSAATVTAPSRESPHQAPAPGLFSGFADAVGFIRDNRLTILTMAMLTLAAVSLGRSRR